MLYLPFADTSINIYVIVLTGVCLGVVGGFFGISGSVILIPALNALGLPMALAVGTNLTLLFGRSVLICVKNNAVKQFQWKFGLIFGLTGAGGIHLGRTMLLYLEGKGMADTVIRSVYIILLFGIGTFILLAYIRSKKVDTTAVCYARFSTFAEKIQGVNLFPQVRLPLSGGKSISLLILVAVGAGIGVLSGVMGMSGSFLRLPVLVFITGLPLLPALCTDVFASIISLGLGVSSFAVTGHIEVMAAILLLLGSTVGVHLGHKSARYVNRNRFTLALFTTVTFSMTGVFLKQLGYDAPAAVMILGCLSVLSAAVILKLIRASYRQNNPLTGLPAANQVSPGGTE